MKYAYDPTSPRVKEAKHVMFIISKALNVTVNKLKGSSRFRHLVDARRICYVILKDQMNLTLGEIGSYFDRDHATVLYSASAMRNLCTIDKRLSIARGYIEKDIVPKLEKLNKLDVPICEHCKQPIYEERVS